MKNIFILIIVLALFPFSAFAGKQGVVTAVNDDLSIVIDGADSVSLSGVFIAPENKDAAKSLIEKKFLNQRVTVDIKTDSLDRGGRAVAQVKSGEKWLQGVLLEAGLASVYISGGNDLLLAEMLKKEAIKPISDKELEKNIAKYKNKFVVAQGVVIAVKVTKSKVYINFDKDWKTDFSVVVRKENFKNFDVQSWDSLTGKTVTVHGWVEDYNGPMIEVYDQWALQVR